MIKKIFLSFAFLTMGFLYANDLKGVWICNNFTLASNTTRVYSWGEDINCNYTASFYIDTVDEKDYLVFPEFGMYKIDKNEEFENKKILFISNDYKKHSCVLIFYIISDWEMYLSEDSDCGYLPKGKNKRYFRIAGKDKSKVLKTPVAGKTTKKTMIIWDDVILCEIPVNTEISIVGVNDDTPYDAKKNLKKYFIKVPVQSVKNLNFEYYEKNNYAIPEYIFGNIEGSKFKFDDSLIK